MITITMDTGNAAFCEPDGTESEAARSHGVAHILQAFTARLLTQQTLPTTNLWPLNDENGNIVGWVRQHTQEIPHWGWT